MPLVEECERIARSMLDIAEAGKPGSVNRELVAALAGHGLFDRLFAAEQVTATELCAMRQGLARVSTHAETAFAVQGLGAIPIHLAATAPAKRTMDPTDSLRSGGGCLRPDRARRRLRRRRPHHPSRGRRRRLPDHRGEGVHLQRTGRRRVHGFRQDHRRRRGERGYRLRRSGRRRRPRRGSNPDAVTTPSGQDHIRRGVRGR